MAIVKITPLAESDLEEIFVYMADNNPDSAAGFLRELGQKFELLAKNPTLGRVHHDYFVELRSFSIKNTSYFIFRLKTAWKSTVSFTARETSKTFLKILPKH